MNELELKVIKEVIDALTQLVEPPPSPPPSPPSKDLGHWLKRVYALTDAPKTRG